MIYFRP